MTGRTEVYNADIFTEETVIAEPCRYFDVLRSSCPVHLIAQPGVLGGPFPPFPAEPCTEDIADTGQGNREHWALSAFTVTEDGVAHGYERSLPQWLMSPKVAQGEPTRNGRLAIACVDEFRDQCAICAEGADFGMVDESR